MKRLSALLLALSLAVPTVAAERFVAFGDSITEGFGDSASPPGYPPKLRKILAKAGLEVTIDNFGLSGETTFEGLSRIDSALAGDPDYLLLMEGTNDINMANGGEVSIEAIVANLDAMGSKARSRGIDTMMGTVLPRPPTARKDSRNTLTRELNWDLYELAADKKRPYADLWARFNQFVDIDVFSTLYSNAPEDTIGHPNNEGYKVIAALFADQILGIDRLAPVPGRFEPFVTELTGATEFEATVYESSAGSGIKLKETYLELNGEVVATPISSRSNRRRASFSHSVGRNRLPCRVVLGFSGRDQAQPPNEFAQLIWAYEVKGREHLLADVNGDCTVDSIDLDQFARSFGAEFGDPTYSILLDLNSDDIIDGIDFAIFASDYGRSTS